MIICLPGCDKKCCGTNKQQHTLVNATSTTHSQPTAVASVPSTRNKNTRPTHNVSIKHVPLTPEQLFQKFFKTPPPQTSKTNINHKKHSTHFNKKHASHKATSKSYHPVNPFSRIFARLQVPPTMPSLPLKARVLLRPMRPPPPTICCDVKHVVLNCNVPPCHPGDCVICANYNNPLQQTYYHPYQIQRRQQQKQTITIVCDYGEC